MVRVLVTGSSGFIGKALCNKLENDKVSFHPVNSDTGDIASPTTWQGYPSAEVVIHLAGCSFVPDSWSKPADFVNTNILGTQNALDYCKRNKSRLIFISAYIYGIPEALPINESHSINPSNPYALSKYLAEQLCEFAVSSRQVSCVTALRLFNVYGAGQREEFLIPSIINKIFKGSEIDVYDLKPRRDFIYIDDVISAITSALKIDCGFNAFNIGSGISHSVKEIIEIIQEVAGTNLSVISSNIERPNEIPDVRADCSKALAVMDWHSRVSFEKGIACILGELNCYS